MTDTVLQSLVEPEKSTKQKAMCKNITMFMRQGDIKLLSLTA